MVTFNFLNVIYWAGTNHIQDIKSRTFKQCCYHGYI